MENATGNTVEEISLVELIKKILKFMLKYNKIISISIIIGFLIGGFVGFKLEMKNSYYKQSITFNDKGVAKGINPDGTKFNKIFLIKGGKGLNIYGSYPTYTVETKKGLKKDEAIDELKKTTSKNKMEYLEKFINVNDTNWIVGETDLVKRWSQDKNSREYKELAIWFLAATNHFENKGKQFEFSEDFYMEIIYLRREVDKYFSIINNNFYTKNIEKTKKEKQFEIDKLDLEKEKRQKKLSELENVLDIIWKKNVTFPEEIVLTPGLTYKGLISEYLKLIWEIEDLKRNLLIEKEYYKKIKMTSEEDSLNLENQENLIFDKIFDIAKSVNPVIKKEYDRRMEELIKIENPILIREVKLEFIVLLGIILGGVLGVLISICREINYCYKK